MSKKRVWFLLATIVLPYVGILSYTGIGKTPSSIYGLVLGFSAMFILVSGVMLLGNYVAAKDPKHSVTLGNKMSYFLAVFAWLGAISFDRHQYYYPGGDVDPVAYLQHKTTYPGGYHLLQDTGGYHLLANKNTYRQFMSQEPHWQLPLSSTTLLSHIPSIIEINKRKVSMNLPHTQRGNECTISLLGAVVHIPFDEVKVGRYLKQVEDRWRSDPEFDITQQLEHVFNPILKSVKEPLPEGTIYIDLDITDGILGHLEEQYGFHIVALPNSTAQLKCTIKYIGDPPANDSIQLLQGKDIRVSNMKELFPPRKKVE